MRIVIVGAGSVGLLLASYLAESGINVTMFVRREEQARLINHNGIRRINEDGSESIFHVTATMETDVISTAELLIVAVKYAHLPKVLESLVLEEVKTPLLFIQNGIGHLDIVKAIEFPHTAFATVEHGALRKDDRTVSHNGVGMLMVGEGVGDARKFDVMESANSELFPVGRHTDAEYILMRKVIINCMINPLTAVLGVKNGELLTNPFCYELFRSLYEELATAFPDIKDSLPLKKVEDVCRKTANNKSSMLADYLAGRPMEIETIVTAVIEKAQALKKNVSLLVTFEKLLYAMGTKELRND